MGRSLKCGYISIIKTAFGVSLFFLIFINFIVFNLFFTIFKFLNNPKRLGEFKHEVRQFEKSYDNQQAEQISLMV